MDWAERSVRAMFVSDVHLGCRFAQPEHFLHFMERIRPEQLFIVGDFLDGWKLRASWRWLPVYTRIVQRLLELAHGGTELFYTPGNHDAFLRCAALRQIVENVAVNVQVQDEFIFHALDGRRFLVIHGDKFDVIETRYRWLSMLTSLVYEPLLLINWWTNRLLRPPGSSPYATCAVIKDKVKTAVRFISSFERDLFRHARLRGCDGVICGHIHKPAVIRSGEMTYLNTGDWVENCTALVEYHDGSIYLESYYPGVPARPVPAAMDIEPVDNDFSQPLLLPGGQFV
jgi:UDP-2,3-diacylglucosamine pyrophosphatase LpxH